ncbi:hypothetical protein [Spirosoma areae]
MPFKNGNTSGKQFSSDYQPADDRKTHGPQRSYVARQVLALRMEVEADTMIELLKSYPQIDEYLTAEELITLMQVHRAVIHQDTAAYKALMDSAYGAPMQPLVGEDGGPVQIDQKAQSTVYIIDTTGGHRIPAPDEDYSNPDK